jgi:tRNA nucleotidyltransferase/poly(A) polymerase
MSLTFRIEVETQKAIKELANEFLPAVSYERIWREIDKASKFPRFYHFFYELNRLGLLTQFLPELKDEENVEDIIETLPENTPTLIKLMAMLGTFDKEKVLEIVRRFNLKIPN